MPMLIYEREDTQRLWTYQEKRDLVENTEKATLKQFTDINLKAAQPLKQRALEPFGADLSGKQLGRPSTKISSRVTKVNVGSLVDAISRSFVYLARGTRRPASVHRRRMRECRSLW